MARQNEQNRICGESEQNIRKSYDLRYQRKSFDTTVAAGIRKDSESVYTIVHNISVCDNINYICNNENDILF